MGSTGVADQGTPQGHIDSPRVSVPIDKRTFEASLDKFLPRPLKDGNPMRKRLRDAQFRQLADFCNRAGHPQWGLRPRTFAVLRMIGFPEAIELFITEKLTDIFLPYSENNLPNFLNGSTRTNFLDCQNYVLNGYAAALEKPGEPHQNVEGSADNYFVYVEDLGAGGFGEVDSVIGEMSLMQFARKRIKRHRLYSKDKASLHVFENELQTLKSLSHRHLVRLVGSYTDASCVGLIMTPVADMNLATYLKATDKPESRKACLRRFFGCLATALSYLHDKHIQHKDIKPANILVKDQQVYLTDFGTSKSWDNETPKTTQGTVLVLTPRYCAPEVVQFGSTRNESRDIWSLGCVFFEMCSVLADRNVDEMVEYFRCNGTRGEYIRENQPASTAWAETLRSTFTLPTDRFPLDLAVSMCAFDPNKRPLAKELMSRILDFSGTPRYYGLCCDELCYSDSYATDHGPGVFNETDRGTIGNDEYTQTGQRWRPKPRYQPPTVDDPTGEMITRAFFPPGGTASKHLLEDVEQSKRIDTAFTFRDDPSASTLKARTHLEPHQISVARATVEANPTVASAHSHVKGMFLGRRRRDGCVSSILANLDHSRLPCPWPTCVETSRTHTMDLLRTHLRDHHGTHGLFWTSLIPNPPELERSAASGIWEPGQILSGPLEDKEVYSEKAFVLKRDIKNLLSTFDSFTNRLKQQVKNKKGKCSGAEGYLASSGSNPILNQSRDLPKSRIDNVESDIIDDSRFSLLPEHCRPETIRPTSDGENDLSYKQDDPVITYEPVPEPFISLDARLNSSEFTIPESSIVPSYFLASANRLTTNQVDYGPRPLFVYGSLMFPSIVRACAARFVSAEGVYSSEMQRRIPTSAQDWASVNESLQHAAQQMTPALLRGHMRFELNDSRDAGLVTHKATYETKGFIISGLSSEALACLDYLFGPEGFKEHAYKGKNSSSPSNTSDESSTTSDSDSSTGNRLSSSRQKRRLDLFVRENVDIVICAPDGEPRRLVAQTFVWKAGPSKTFEHWRINRFLKCSSFRRLSTNKESPNYDWVGEESRLADKMGMMYAMLGDELCNKVLKGDLDAVESLVEDGSDVNASCHHYGTPLQAAAVMGEEQIVYVMIKYLKADPNIEAGKYRFPIIAAVSEGHETVVETLLRYGANPLVAAGPFISPIYQAVSFGDVKMTELLLEKGAWLTKDYQELLDLAMETRNHGIWDLLKEYDIRNLHKVKSLEEDSGQSHRKLRSTDKGVLKQRPREVMPALMEMLRLKGRKGKWTGIKAVKVLRIYYGDQIDEHVLRFISQHLTSIQTILTDVIKGGNHERALLDDRKKSEISVGAEDALRTIQDNSRAPKDDFEDYRISSKGRSDIDRHRSGLNNDTDDEPLCLTCDGRGGRKGTGRFCSDCRGKGLIEQPLEARRPMSRHRKRCRACNGIGNIFSERDRCRACNEPRSHYKGLAQDQGTSNRSVESKSGMEKGTSPSYEPRRRQHHSDPPPPYPGS